MRKQNRVAALLAVGMMSAATAVHADAWLRAEPRYGEVGQGQSGRAHVGVVVNIPASVTTTSRAPMAVSLVIDTSGSMAGDRMQQARNAAMRMVSRLHNGDLVSVYAFSQAVSQVAPLTRIGPSTREDIISRIGRLRSGGGTAMHAGLNRGIVSLAGASSEHSVRRVFLISDGHAIVGPSSPSVLGNLARGATEYNAQITSIGVGVGYDESTLGSIAVRSQGRFYHLAQPYQLAAILEQELDALSQTVAVQAHIEFTPRPGCHIRKILTPGAVRKGRKVVLPLGSLHGGQERTLLFETNFGTSSLGMKHLGEAKLVFFNPTGPRKAQVLSSVVLVDVTKTGAGRLEKRSQHVDSMVYAYEAYEAERQAAAALRRGDRLAAQRHFSSGASSFDKAERAAPAAKRGGYRRKRSRAATRSSSAQSRPAAAMAKEAEADSLEGFGY